MSNNRPLHMDKTSDRRAAAAAQPNRYLNSTQDLQIKDPIHLQHSVELFKEIKDKSKNPSKYQNSKKAVERIDPKTGQKWFDNSLVDWDPSHFRLFIGNLGDEVDEELLFRTFIKYPSLSKVKVPMSGKEEKKSKGYGFISFADPDDYLQCFKEMNGKYVGSKPIELKKAKAEIGKTVNIKQQRKKNKNKRRTLV